MSNCKRAEEEEVGISRLPATAAVLADEFALLHRSPKNWRGTFSRVGGRNFRDAKLLRVDYEHAKEDAE